MIPLTWIIFVHYYSGLIMCLYHMYLCIMIFLFSVVVVSPKKVTGHRGERVDIRCRYESGYESNSKYFCKGKCNYRNKNIVVKSGSPAKDERFSLTDDKRSRVFTVSITDLRTTDQGRYWCVVERTFPFIDVYSEILLLVTQMKKSAKDPTISSFSNTPSYFSTTETNPRSSSITITERKETSTDQHKSAGQFICLPLHMTPDSLLFK
uniref:Immunoglobulin domain-containing protein n=1 Tax=Cyprinus carpio TaxID=7962 RepID=A0A8C2BKJ5_CYPCA